MEILLQFRAEPDYVILAITLIPRANDLILLVEI